MAHLIPEVFFPESRVLIIITGGTICMKRSENGLIPVRVCILHRIIERVEGFPEV